MREIVALGTFEHTQDLIARHTGGSRTSARRWASLWTRSPRTDPFFAKDGGRALLHNG